MPVALLQSNYHPRRPFRMKTPRSSRHGFGAALAALLGFGFGLQVSAETVTTVPVGAVTITIAGSPNGTTYTTTPISAPLYGTPLVPNGEVATIISGLVSGSFTGFGANTLTSSSAGWVPSQLTQVGYPMFVSIKSGVNAGRLFHITSNTATTLTVNTQGLDLSTMNFVQGDTYEIVPGDTLEGLFGTPASGVIGGTSAQYTANLVDKILINDPSSNAILTYYYNTTNSRWQRVGTSANQGNLVISPRMGVEYQRISTSPLTITLIGSVPATALKQQIPTFGASIMARYYPADTTLLALGLHNMSGWRKVGVNGITTANCDRVFVKVGSAFFSYYYDSATSGWKRAGTSAGQNGVVISAGSSYRVLRAGDSGSYDTLNQSTPYSL